MIGLFIHVISNSCSVVIRDNKNKCSIAVQHGSFSTDTPEIIFYSDDSKTKSDIEN